MSPNQMYQILLGLIAIFGGWYMRVQWNTIKELERSLKHADLNAQRIEIKLISDYVTTEKFDKSLGDISNKLDIILTRIDANAEKFYEKLNDKVDKKEI